MKNIDQKEEKKKNSLKTFDWEAAKMVQLLVQQENRMGDGKALPLRETCIWDHLPSILERP